MPLPAPWSEFGQRADDGLDFLAGNRTRAQQGHAAVQHGHHGALDPNGAIAAVDQGRREGAGLLDRIGESSRAGAAGPVGGRGDDGAAEGGDDGAGAGVARHADSDAVQSSAGQVADTVAIPDRGHDRQRTGPEGLGEGAGAGVEHSDGLGLDGVGDMGDQGVEAGAALGLEDGGDGDGVAGVRSEAIDGLGRQDDEATVGQGPRGLGVRHSQARCA